VSKAKNKAAETEVPEAAAPAEGEVLADQASSQAPSAQSELGSGQSVAEPSASEPAEAPETGPASSDDQPDGVEAWKDRALRAQAEMANMRRRLASDTEDRTRRRMEALLHDLITVADHMDLALASIPAEMRDTQGADAFLMGMEAIRMALENVMRQHGLEFIQPEAEAAFDPELHEAVQTADEADLEHPRLEILRRGYRMGSKILRPAQVRVISPADMS
jgi:molecular chaperone GrpE